MAKFLESDKELLAEICKKHPAVFDKSYTSDSLIKKNSAWRDVCNEFNILTGNNPREVSQLQGLWKRMKVKAKEEEGGKIVKKKMVDGTSISSASQKDQLDEENAIDNSCNLLDMQSEDDIDDIFQSPAGEEEEHVLIDQECEVVMETPDEVFDPSCTRNASYPDGTEEQVEIEVDKNYEEIIELETRRETEFLINETALFKKEIAMFKQETARVHRETAVIKKETAVLKKEIAIFKKRKAQLKNKTVRLKLEALKKRRRDKCNTQII